LLPLEAFNIFQRVSRKLPIDSSLGFQDLKDKPALVLLEWIKSERAKVSKGEKRQRPQR
jgi:hypothetical protein